MQSRIAEHGIKQIFSAQICRYLHILDITEERIFQSVLSRLR